MMTVQWHLGWGQCGIKHCMEHFVDPLAGMSKNLGAANITPEPGQTITAGVMQKAANRSVEQLAKEENDLLVRLLHSRSKAGGGELIREVT
jgi:hypothetical protein